MSRYYKRLQLEDMIGYPIFLIRKCRERIGWWMIWDIIIFEKYCLKEILNENGREAAEETNVK